MAGPRGAGSFPRVFTPTHTPEIDTDPSLGQRLATLNAEMTRAVDTMNDRLEQVANRVVGVEAGQRSLTEDARQALEQLLSRAREEFERQGFSLLALRSEVQQEARELRAYLTETRGAVEHIYSGASTEFSNLQRAVLEDHQKLVDLAARVENSGHPGGGQPAGYPQPQQSRGAPAQDQLGNGRGDLWQQGGANHHRARGRSGRPPRGAGNPKGSLDGAWQSSQQPSQPPQWQSGQGPQPPERPQASPGQPRPPQGAPGGAKGPAAATGRVLDGRAMGHGDKEELGANGGRRSL